MIRCTRQWKRVAFLEVAAADLSLEVSPRDTPVLHLRADLEWEGN